MVMDDLTRERFGVRPPRLPLRGADPIPLDTPRAIERRRQELLDAENWWRARHRRKVDREDPEN